LNNILINVLFFLSFLLPSLTLSHVHHFFLEQTCLTLSLVSILYLAYFFQLFLEVMLKTYMAQYFTKKAPLYFDHIHEFISSYLIPQTSIHPNEKLRHLLSCVTLPNIFPITESDLIFPFQSQGNLFLKLSQRQFSVQQITIFNDLTTFNPFTIYCMLSYSRGNE
jgi:hypothetical protein